MELEAHERRKELFSNAMDQKEMLRRRYIRLRKRMSVY